MDTLAKDLLRCGTKTGLCGGLCARVHDGAAAPGGVEVDGV